MLQKTLILVSISVIIFTSCAKSKYDSAYAKILSPSDNSVFHSGDTINFLLDGQTSGLMMEFDNCFFKLYNTETGELLYDDYLKDTVQYLPTFSDTTVLLASAEYWQEDASEAYEKNQIYITILP